MINTVYLPKLDIHVKLMNRDAIRRGHPMRSIAPKGPLPTATLPINWYQSFDFPMLGNDQYGDCMYAAACHGDQTFTGNNGKESAFDEATVISYYKKLSGGDNGLDEGQLVGEWEKGLCGEPTAKILDALDFDPTNDDLLNLIVQMFGGFIFMLDVPNKWISEFDGSGDTIWDAPASPNPLNGHGVWINGVDTNGNKKIQTWGSSVWMTPEGLKSCDPSAFVVWSNNWFNAEGKAPNGHTHDDLAALWVQLGGKQIPPFVPPGPDPNPNPIPPTPPPGPPPTPPVTNSIVIDTDSGVFAIPDSWTVQNQYVSAMTIRPNIKVINPGIHYKQGSPGSSNIITINLDSKKVSIPSKWRITTKYGPTLMVRPNIHRIDLPNGFSQG